MKQLAASLFLLIVVATAKAQTSALNEELIEAVQRSDAAAVKALLKKGADVNGKNVHGATPIFYACDRGNAEIVKLLLDAGADANVRDPNFNSMPMAFAISRDHADVVLLLLKKLPNKTDLVMTEAVRWNRIKTATALLATGSFKPEHLNYLLSLAETNGYSELAEKLIKAGAKSKPKTEFKLDPGQLLRYEGHFESEKLEASLKVKNGRLICTVNGAVLTLKPIAEHTFESQEQSALLTFNLEDRKVVGLTLKSRGGDVKLKKVEGK